MKQQKYTIEGELAKALVRFSYGRLTIDEAKETASIAAKNWDSSNKALAHKGLNWYAKQLLAKKLFEITKGKKNYGTRI